MLFHQQLLDSVDLFESSKMPSANDASLFLVQSAWDSFVEECKSLKFGTATQIVANAAWQDDVLALFFLRTRKLAESEVDQSVIFGCNQPSASRPPFSPRQHVHYYSMAKTTTKSAAL